MSICIAYDVINNLIFQLKRSFAFSLAIAKSKEPVVVSILSHRHHNKLVQSTGFRYRGKLFELKSWLKLLNTAYSNKLLEILLLQIITRDKSVRRPGKAAERQSHEQR